MDKNPTQKEMRHYYTILSYNKNEDSFSCKNNSDDSIRCLFLDYLDLDSDAAQNLIGKTISVSYLIPVTEQAINPIIEN